ncbi:MAG: hypothetical protein ACEQSM_04735, partial [Aliarcobacter sp.]
VPGSETRAESAASRPTPNASSAPKPTPAAAPSPTPSPVKTPTQKPTTPSSSAKETFLNDPAIRAALKQFDARVIDQSN